MSEKKLRVPNLKVVKAEEPAASSVEEDEDARPRRAYDYLKMAAQCIVDLKGRSLSYLEDVGPEIKDAYEHLSMAVATVEAFEEEEAGEENE